MLVRVIRRLSQAQNRNAIFFWELFHQDLSNIAYVADLCEELPVGGLGDGLTKFRNLSSW